MNKPLHVACLQLHSNEDMEANIQAIAPLVMRARERGAELILLPENAFFLQSPGGKAVLYAEHNHPGVQAARGWAQALGCVLLIGSVMIASESPGEARAFNRSLLIGREGAIAARYDKIHLFDVTLPNGENYTESARCLPGGQAVLAATPWGGLGMTVCYDVRFSGLYRLLAQGGASMLSVPAAFTHTTGEAHWHVLLRARAIENGCFVFAPAQCGVHTGGRRTYGHSLIIDPWGRILAEGSADQPGIIEARIDLSQVEEVRARVPSLRLEREFHLYPAARN